MDFYEFVNKKKDILRYLRTDSSAKNFKELRNACVSTDLAKIN